MCTLLLPPGVNPIAGNKSIISYHIISYHIISYHIISYHITSYHIISYHIISYHISYHIISHHITSYIILYHIIPYLIIYYIMSYLSPQQHQCENLQSCKVKGSLNIVFMVFTDIYKHRTSASYGTAYITVDKGIN